MLSSLCVMSDEDLCPLQQTAQVWVPGMEQVQLGGTWFGSDAFGADSSAAMDSSVCLLLFLHSDPGCSILQVRPVLVSAAHLWAP